MHQELTGERDRQAAGEVQRQLDVRGLLRHRRNGFVMKQGDEFLAFGDGPDNHRRDSGREQ